MEFFPFDDEYVRRLREGDRLTEDHFVSYITPLLRLKVRGRLPSREAEEDALQETFIRVFRTLRGAAGSGVRDGRSFGAYVLSICNNVIFESYRGKRTEPIDDEYVANIPTADDREAELIEEQQRECVRRVVSGMDARERNILTAIYFNERPKAAVCEEFGVDNGYLRVLLHRAREKFRKAWAKEQRRGPHGPDETDRPRPSLLR
jgi:RNA polymerase sigma-70 factor (ECF subfamily)